MRRKCFKKSYANAFYKRFNKRVGLVVLASIKNQCMTIKLEIAWWNIFLPAQTVIAIVSTNNRISPAA